MIEYFFTAPFVLCCLFTELWLVAFFSEQFPNHRFYSSTMYDSKNIWRKWNCLYSLPGS